MINLLQKYFFIRKDKLNQTVLKYKKIVAICLLCSLLIFLKDYLIKGIYKHTIVKNNKFQLKFYIIDNNDCNYISEIVCF